MERPWWKFCGRDWLGDLELLRCSIGARGLWIAMLCLMNEGKPYGHLADKKGAILPRELANLQRITPIVCEKFLAELEVNEVFSRTSEGIIFSRRMVRDERERLLAVARKEKFNKRSPVVPNGTRTRSVVVQNDAKNALRASDSDSDSDSGISKKNNPTEETLSLSEPFDWFQNVFLGEIEDNVYIDLGQCVNTPELLELFVENTPLWMKTDKYSSGHGKSAKWFIRDGVWKRPPPPPRKSKHEQMMEDIANGR